ncbi:MAG: hypothetical protein RL173_1320, partial [Fibrobacterota bacterium]
KEDGSLIHVLVTAIDRVAKPPQKTPETVICFGYASSAGEANPNRKLSLRRAQVVKAILERDSGAWDGLAKANFETVDIQQFLSDLHKACGWECDPGAVDGQAGPKTKAAIESFQRECNGRYKLGLKDDGVAGPKTWGAVLRVIHGQVQSALGQDPSKEPSWAKPKWGHGGKGVYANGEDFASGGDKPEERSVQITFFSQGSEPKLVDKTDAAVTKTDNPVHDETKVVREKVVSGGGEIKKDAPLDGIVLWDMVADKVAVMDKSMLRDFEREAAAMQKVAEVIGKILDLDATAGETRDQTEVRASKVLAANEFLESLIGMTSPAESLAYAEKVEQEIEKLAAKHRQNIYSTAADRVKSGGMKSGWIKKVYWADGKKAVWVRGDRILPKLQWDDRRAVQAAIRDKAKSDAEKGEKHELEIKTSVKLYEKAFFDPKEGTWVPSVEKYCRDHGWTEMLKDTRNFDASASMQVMRWAAEGKASASFDWSKEKTIKAEAKVEGHFNLAAAKGQISFHAPDKDGFDLIAALRRVTPNLVKPSAKPLSVKLKITTSGQAAVCITAAASGGAALTLKDGKREAKTSCGIELFAGAKAGAECEFAVQVNLLNDKTQKWAWKSMATTTVGGWVAVGFGAQASFVIGYYEDKFQMKMEAGLVVKGGAGKYLMSSLDAVSVWDLIWTLANAVEWSKLSHYIREGVWHLYQGVTFQAAITGEALAVAAEHFREDLAGIMKDSGLAMRSGLRNLKSYDDSWDKKVPGYSGFKQHNSAFLILKNTYYLIEDLTRNLDLRDKALKVVEQIEAKSGWRYLTPEWKENLIADLTSGEKGHFGDFSDEDREKAIIKILKSCRGNEERKVIHNKLRDTRKIFLEKILDGSQLEEFSAFVKSIR